MGRWKNDECAVKIDKKHKRFSVLSAEELYRRRPLEL